MWTCPKCGRIFAKKGQVHSCHKFPIQNHFKNKEYAKELYDHILEVIKKKVGPVKQISLPCCIHLFGNYDFIALLPKKNKLEVRFALDKKIKSKRIFAVVPLSKSTYKNCLYIFKKAEVDRELMEWIKQSYSFKS